MGKVYANHEWVLIEPTTRNSIEARALYERSGLFVKRKAQGPPNIGHIRSIGNLVPKDYGLKVGQKVAFNEPTPDGRYIDGVGYIPVNYRKILGVLK